jgi:hypothetical protein
VYSPGWVFPIFGAATIAKWNGVQKWL